MARRMRFVPLCLAARTGCFSGSPEGAEGSCFMFSLIETGPAERTESLWVLVHVFTKAPEIGESGNWEDLLPWNIKDDLLELKSIVQA
jgi:hypothetical protein